MDANVLFGKALGLGSGWKVVKSEMDVAGRELKIWLDFESGSQFACPQCGEFSPVHDTVENGITARPASDAAQKQALDFLCSRASPDLPIEAATPSPGFHAKPRPEALPALRRLLDHPSLTVAKEAAAALESAGEKADIPPKLGPVRYRIEVDGKPYAARRVEWIVRWGITNMWTSSEEPTDAHGVAHVPRDMFLDKSSRPIKGVTCAARPSSDSRTRCSACSCLLLPILMT